MIATSFESGLKGSLNAIEAFFVPAEFWTALTITLPSTLLTD